MPRKSDFWLNEALDKLPTWYNGSIRSKYLPLLLFLLNGDLPYVRRWFIYIVWYNPSLRTRTKISPIASQWLNSSSLPIVVDYFLSSQLIKVRLCTKQSFTTVITLVNQINVKPKTQHHGNSYIVREFKWSRCLFRPHQCLLSYRCVS